LKYIIKIVFNHSLILSGYCPQEDALLSLLTGAEHLKLFASLRGVPKRYLKKVLSLPFPLISQLIDCNANFRWLMIV